MLRRANQACLRFWRDESGVVLAVSVVLLLTLVVMAFAVYAVGDAVHARIELQNAADAAAYTAAVVEADALSRLAAINRAMGWTYVQAVKMHMDYIQGKWITLTYFAHEIVYRVTKKIASKSRASCGRDWYYAGQSDHWTDNSIRINRKQWWDCPTEVKPHTWRSVRPPLGKMIKAHLNIVGMNVSERVIIKTLPLRIRRAVTKSLRANIRNTANDRFARPFGADLRYALLHDVSTCFRVMDDEHMFLRSVFGRGVNEAQLFGPGSESGGWYVPQSGVIQRDYEQLGDRLVAEWDWRAMVKKTRFCITVFDKSGHIEIPAEKFRDKLYPSPTCKPQAVNRDYFGRPGAMLVAVARRSVHPFQFLFRWREPTGIYRAYTINPPGSAPARYAWAVAAARAGYRDFGRPDGSYNPTVDSWENEREMALPVDELPGWWRRNNGWEGLSPHNLSLSDWDAVLLPLHRAWSTRVPAWQNRGPASGAGAERSPGYWQSRTAAEILDELWSHAEWRPLYLGPRGQGLRTWARGEGPVGMTGSIDYGGMEDKVFH